MNRNMESYRAIQELFASNPEAFPEHSAEYFDQGGDRELGLRMLAAQAKRGGEINTTESMYPYRTPEGELMFRRIGYDVRRTNMADESTELGALSEAVATGIIAMAEDVGGDVEYTEQDRMDMAELVNAAVEIAAAVDAGDADLGAAGAIMMEFLETNPEIADAAAEIGASLLAGEGGGGPPEGDEAPSASDDGPPPEDDEPPDDEQ